jgi:DNA gyrase subunit A
MGRATQGVRLINLRENDSIASVAKVDTEGPEVNSDQTVNETDADSDGGETTQIEGMVEE